MSRTRDPRALVEAARSGDRSALARLLSAIERGGPEAREVGRLTFPLSGRAYTVGLTGAPGAGKSTLTDQLISRARAGAGGPEVGVLAVDPSSPFSGGAILGDRVRMQEHALDPGVFIRSMASRGHLGGLALATREAIRALDAAGLPWVLVETVGVGQVEVDIAQAADTTVVVVNPGWGDSVQANKADRPGADETARDLARMLDMSPPGDWRPPVVKCVSTTGEGLDGVWETIGGHRRHLEDLGLLGQRRQRRLEEELRQIVVRRLEQEAYGRCSGPEFGRLLAQLQERRIDPYTAAEALIGAE